MIYVIGGTGYIGSTFVRLAQSFNTTSSLILIKSPRSGQSFELEGFEYIDFEEFLKVKLSDSDWVVNLSNYYLQEPVSQEEKVRMYESIVGVTDNILVKAAENSFKLIHFSSFFQNMPISDLKFAKSYVEMKELSRAKIANLSSNKKCQVLDVTLFDNYGGYSRGKILDKLLNSVYTDSFVNVKYPEQKINLIHVLDIAKTLWHIIESFYFQVDYERFEIRSDDDFTIRQLVELIQNSSNLKLNVFLEKNLLSYPIPYKFPVLRHPQKYLNLSDWIKSKFDV